MGGDFSTHYDDCNLHLKSSAQIIHTFLDIVCKCGNLALNITPQPDGEFVIVDTADLPLYNMKYA